VCGPDRRASREHDASSMWPGELQTPSSSAGKVIRSSCAQILLVNPSMKKQPPPVRDKKPVVLTTDDLNNVRGGKMMGAPKIGEGT
jgi:hypothetical protein